MNLSAGADVGFSLGGAAGSGAAYPAEDGTMRTECGTMSSEGGSMASEGGIMTSEGGSMTSEGGTLISEGDTTFLGRHYEFRECRYYDQGVIT